jgi:hypothetical protein
VGNSVQKLEAMGFVCCGIWHPVGGTQLQYVLERHATAQNVLYAFIVSGKVAYIGKTTQLLQRRMYGYQRPGPTQSTNIRCNALLRKSLQAGEAIAIHALPDNGLLYYGGFHVNLAAGLEDSIIGGIKPRWNSAGV